MMEVLMKYLKGFIIMALSVTIAGFALGQMNQDTQQGQQDRQHMMPGQNQQQSQSGGMMQGKMMHGGMMGMMSGHMGMMSGGMMGMHAPSVQTILMQSNRLNLSAEQVKALQQQSLNLRKDLVDLRSELQQHQLEYQEYLLSENVRQQRVLNLIEETQSMQADLQKRLAKSYFDAQDELNAEQRENVIVMHPGMQMMQQSDENSMGMRGHQNMMQQN
jgi:hypothetical protein